MNDPLTLKDASGDTLRIYESSGIAYMDDVNPSFQFTEDTLISTINSLHRMLDHLITENAKRDVNARTNPKSE